MKRTFAFGAATGQGTWPVQEDGFFADPVRGVFAVADGFGGRGAGDMAAKAALLGVRAHKIDSGKGNGLTPGLRAQKEIFLEAHRAITARNQGKNGNARGGCSLVLAKVNPGEVDLSHCGACAVLLARNGSIRPLLLPQASPREEFQPLMPEQALGVGEEALPETRNFRGKVGDVLILVSSGVEWESESFQAEALAQLGARLPGTDLSLTASQLVENGGLSAQGWNRTILLVELI